MSNVTIYRITNKEMPGHVYLIYENGILASFQNETRESIFNPDWLEVKACLCQHESELKRIVTHKVELIKTKTIKEKVIAFCAWYKHHRKVSYLAKTNETANLKTVPVTDALLTAFFTSDAWFVQNNYTMSNYISRINLLKDFIKNGAALVKSKFPDQYDSAFEAKCSPEQLNAYRAHLRSLGYVYVRKGASGTWQRIHFKTD